MAIDTAEVDVKSALASKINWTQVAAILAMIFSWFGLDLPAEKLVEVFAAIQTISAVATLIFRTWFTKSVTPSVARHL